MAEMSVDEALNRANAEIQAGRHQEAKNLLEAVLKVEDKNPRALIGFSVVSFQQGDLPNAINYVSGIVLDNSFDADLLSTCSALLRSFSAQEFADRVEAIKDDAEKDAQIIKAHLNSFLKMADFGSSGEAIVSVPSGIASAIHFISLDALSVGSNRSKFGRYTPINCVIAPTAGDYEFREKYFIYGSSLLEAKHEIIDAFGLQELSKIKAVHKVKAKRMSDALDEIGISSLDYFKSDLEGIDGLVLRDAQKHIGGAAVVQAELRFMPAYKGEPYFDETVAYMRGHDFEVLHLTNENWRYATQHRDQISRGRTVFADTVFVKNIESYLSIHGRTTEAVVRYCLACGVSGSVNYAEFIIENHKELVPKDVGVALTNYLIPRARFGTPQFAKPRLGHVAMS
ncbi:tetratricopeptide repeat protein [Methylobacterium oryzae]|uniref:tetratricopeptide repeat protein n=1 Tax=Methylobacterium oryzae TaxID=334852 RepID=UPI002F35FE95